MAEYIERGALMQFPIRRDHYDRKNGNKHFINGIETVLEYAEQLLTVDAEVVVRCKECEHAERYERTDGTAGYYCGHPQNTFVYGERWNRLFKPVKEADDFCSSGERKEGAEC